MKPTVQSISDTGTSYGYSYWTQWLGCGRKAALRESQPKKLGLSGIEPIDVGVVTHALLENWYTIVKDAGGDAADRWDTRLLKWQDPSGLPDTYASKVYREADRLFQQWRLNHDPMEFGVPYAIEEKYELAHFYAWPKFTIRPDLVVRITDAQAMAMALPGGGYYTIDFKTWGREKTHDHTYSLTDLRFHCYMEAFVRATGFSKEYRGNIVAALYRGRKVYFKRYFLPYERYDGNRVQTLTLETFEARARARINNPRIDNTQCVTPYRDSVCQFYLNGCDGY